MYLLIIWNCENCLRAPHCKDWVGREGSKFLRAAGCGIILGASKAGGTWSVRDKILWKWGSLPRYFLPLFVYFPRYLFSCIVPSSSSSAIPTSKPLSQPNDIRRLLADLANSWRKPGAGQCTGLWSHLQAAVGVLGGKSRGAELSWFGLHQFGQFKVCGKSCANEWSFHSSVTVNRYNKCCFGSGGRGSLSVSKWLVLWNAIFPELNAKISSPLKETPNHCTWIWAGFESLLDWIKSCSNRRLWVHMGKAAKYIWSCSPFETDMFWVFLFFFFFCLSF